MKVKKIESDELKKYLLLKKSLEDNIEQRIEEKYNKYLSLVKRNKKKKKRVVLKKKTNYKMK